MGFNDIYKILILFIIFILFLVWIIYYLFSIRLSNRIKNSTIKSNKIDKDSIFDDITNWYHKEKVKISNKLNIDKKNKQKVEIISTSIDAIFCSITLIIIYLLLSLFYLTIPRISIILLIGIIGIIIPNAITLLKQKYNKIQIEKNLLKCIVLINNGLSSGQSIREAINNAKDKLDGAIKEELQIVINDLEHGLSLATSFKRMEDRTGVNDIVYLTTTLSMLSKTGGNIVLVFNYLEKIFNTREKLKQELNVTVASAKLVFIIMIIIPILIFGGMLLLYNNFVTLFLLTPLGNLLGMLIVLLYILYIITIQKLMKIDEY